MTNSRPLGPLTPFIDATAGTASAVTFGALSALRRARAFHPSGIAVEATLDVEAKIHTGAPLFDRPGRRRCVVRFSRGAGMPEPLPDILGLALRVLDVGDGDRCQDFLLVTSGAAPLVRSALIPAQGYADRQYSSLLPYRVGTRTVLIGARPLLSGGRSPRTFAELGEALADARLRFVLEIAEPAGDWEPMGTIDFGRTLSEQESEALQFNVFNNTDGIDAVGVLNTIRRRAYEGSQRGRPKPVAQRTTKV
ncbi:MAG: hypothetical protein ACLGHT_05390 [Acidimicrobiia bacterium]